MTALDSVGKGFEQLSITKEIAQHYDPALSPYSTAYRKTILRKLQAYGSNHKATDILRPYFQDRMNRVRLGSVLSEWRSVDRGCLQGSSLSPLLWNLY